MLQKMGLIRIDTSLTREDNQFLASYTHSCTNICVVIACRVKTHYQQSKDANNILTTFNRDLVWLLIDVYITELYICHGNIIQYLISLYVLLFIIHFNISLYIRPLGISFFELRTSYEQYKHWCEYKNISLIY